MKRLPGQNWSASLVPSSPNFMGGIGATGFVEKPLGILFLEELEQLGNEP